MSSKNNIQRYADKTVEIISWPVKAFFGSDERSFATLFTLMIGFLYFGFDTAAIITSVYDAMFGFAGMQKYRETGTSDSVKDDAQLDEWMEQMNEASSVLQEIQDEEEEQVQ